MSRRDSGARPSAGVGKQDKARPGYMLGPRAPRGLREKGPCLRSQSRSRLSWGRAEPQPPARETACAHTLSAQRAVHRRALAGAHSGLAQHTCGQCTCPWGLGVCRGDGVLRAPVLAEFCGISCCYNGLDPTLTLDLSSQSRLLTFTHHQEFNVTPKLKMQRLLHHAPPEA